MFIIELHYFAIAAAAATQNGFKTYLLVVPLPLPQPQVSMWTSPLVTMESNCYNPIVESKTIAASAPCERTFKTARLQ